MRIWHIMLSEFKNDKNITETAKKISRVYGHDVITNQQVQKWFSKFLFSDTLLKDQPKPGYSSDLDQDASREWVECSLRKSVGYKKEKDSLFPFVKRMPFFLYACVIPFFHQGLLGVSANLSFPFFFFFFFNSI